MVDLADASGPTALAAAAKKKRGGRRLARGQDGLFDVAGSELLSGVLAGEIGVRPPRRPGWLAKQLGLRGAKSVTRWKQKKARPELAQAIALQMLFPWIPISAWLTEDEREVVQKAYVLGQTLAALPPPNPKTASRKKDRIDPRQVTLEEIIASRVPTKPKAPATVVEIDEPDLGDWDPDGLEPDAKQVSP